MIYCRVIERAVGLMLLAGVFVVGASCSARIDVDGVSARNSKKTTICHKERKTLSVSKSALKAHLRHGDTLGSCRYY